MKTLTAQQRADADARREKFRGFVKHLAKMSAVERAEMAARLPVIVTADAHPLSGRNTLLLALQCPAATVVGGFRQWLQHGRCVRKGEHGHMIWFPKTPKQDEHKQPGEISASEMEIHFLIGTVFDVSQTEELPQDHPAAITRGLVTA